MDRVSLLEETVVQKMVVICLTFRPVLQSVNLTNKTLNVCLNLQPFLTSFPSTTKDAKKALTQMFGVILSIYSYHKKTHQSYDLGIILL